MFLQLIFLSFLFSFSIEITGFCRINKDFQVNTNFTESQQAGSLASFEGEGRFLAVWESEHEQRSYFDIFGQFFNSTGGKIGEEFKISNDTSSIEQSPELANLANGGYLVIWESWNVGLNNVIKCQIFFNNGTKNGDEFVVHQSADIYSESPTVCGLLNEGFVVGDLQESPAIADLSNGGFVVVWMNYNSSISLYNILGQIFTENGTPVWDVFQANDNDGNNKRGPSVSSLPNGCFVVVWESISLDGLYEIVAQIFWINGTKNGEKIPINEKRSTKPESPEVVVVSENGFLVVWHSYNNDGSSYGIFAQIVSLNGTKNGSNFQVNEFVISSQINPDAAPLFDDESFVVIWESDYQDENEWGIFGQIFTRESGNVVGTIPDQHYDIGDPISFNISSGLFVFDNISDIEYSSELQNGDQLPPWIDFNPLSYFFYGVAQQAFNQTIKVIANKYQCSFELFAPFQLVVFDTISCNISNFSTTVTMYSSFEFVFPENLFSFSVPSAISTNMTLLNGDPLPYYLHYDPDESRLFGTASGLEEMDLKIIGTENIFNTQAYSILHIFKTYPQVSSVSFLFPNYLVDLMIIFILGIIL
ncbi:hypothetical protein M0811_01579 [Anaeramoeba ignava]|uniref:Uncharacterized protein n=1 Tax=Anaeramoeba ignava TaxID=1746090 RepID=A0A9Q0R9Z2_ANAIG|nr:hypothetical protein M0811_01579 [Anaeramoeba ignava]